MKKLLYICDWLPPDFGAVGQYSQLFAREYAEQDGTHVILIGLASAKPSVTASAKPSVTTEKVGAGTLTTVRLQAKPYNRARLGRRLAWTLVTNLRIMGAVWKHRRGADRIIFTGSPPFLLQFIVPLNWLWRCRLEYRITDFHPECLMATLKRVPAPLALFHRLTCRLRHRIDRFQILGQDQKRRLMEIGIPPERIVLKRDPSPVVIRGDEEPLDRPDILAGYKVLLYSGNFGVAHDVDTFIEGYRRHHALGSGRVALWLNATGYNADVVEARLREEGLPIARSHLVPLDQVARLLITPDIHLITLRDSFVGYVMPSKVYGCIASGRSVLYIGSSLSDVHMLCRNAAESTALPYRQVDPGDPAGVAAALEAFAGQEILLPPTESIPSRQQRQENILEGMWLSRIGIGVSQQDGGVDSHPLYKNE